MANTKFRCLPVRNFQIETSALSIGVRTDASEPIGSNADGVTRASQMPAHLVLARSPLLLVSCIDFGGDTNHRHQSYCYFRQQHSHLAPRYAPEDASSERTFTSFTSLTETTASSQDIEGKGISGHLDVMGDGTEVDRAGAATENINIDSMAIQQGQDGRGQGRFEDLVQGNTGQQGNARNTVPQCEATAPPSTAADPTLPCHPLSHHLL
ncbi:hypothetical protein R3P38DRAFT_2808671 [Favolaschia claudopus]|uniref:Uncharacterized protein n=1 Tax=Favolaschia claudopus TaxID=2862362 RepID=A0AAV9ZGG5_9AGAR